MKLYTIETGNRLCVAAEGSDGKIRTHTVATGSDSCDYWYVPDRSATALHDIMSEKRYGDMHIFAEKLKAEGYEEVTLIPTDNGKFMSKAESLWMGLSGSMILTGRK